jgi:hypothetical protein
MIQFATRAVLILLAAVVFPVGAQVTTPTALTAYIKNIGYFSAGEPVSIELEGDWPFSCEPVRSSSALDESRKEFVVDILFATFPCQTQVTRWQHTSPQKVLAQGRYQVVVRAGYLTGGIAAEVTTSFPVVLKTVLPLLIEKQSLLVNPGVADAEQFLQVTALETCPPLALKPSIVQSGGSINVRLDYSYLANILCPSVPVGPRSFTRLVSLGKFSAGTYEVVVTADWRGATDIIMKDSLALKSAPATPSKSTGVWYDPNESGWGMTFTESNGVVFIAWFVHDLKRPYWYVMTGAKRDGAVIRGEIASIAGASDFRSNWNPAAATTVRLGEAVITFRDADSASVTSIVNAFGASVTRNVKRLNF